MSLASAILASGVYVVIFDGFTTYSQLTTHNSHHPIPSTLFRALNPENTSWYSTKTP